MKQQRFSIVVAMDANHGIGDGARMFWKLAEELSYFQRLTVGKGNNAVIMGRKTWDSLPSKPLPNRMNIVLTRNYSWLQDGAKAFGSLNEALTWLGFIQVAANIHQVFVIGGGQVYKEALRHPMLETIYITQLFAKVTPTLPITFPEVDEKTFRQHYCSAIQMEQDRVSGKLVCYQYFIYTRKQQWSKVWCFAVCLLVILAVFLALVNRQS